MAQQFSGIRDFVAAVTGGGGIQQAGYDATTERLIKQRSAQAQLDKRLEDAALAKDINVQRQGALGAIEDPLLRGISGANSGFGANFSAGQSGIQTGLENQALQQAIKAVTGALEAGKPVPTDDLNALNALISHAQQGAGNVQVQDQATSIINKNDTASDFNVARTEAVDAKLQPQLDALEALTGQRNAAATKSATADATKPIALENPSKEQMSLLYGPDTEVPGRFYGTNTVPGEDLYPAFEKWRTEQAIAGNDVGDSGIAVQKFLASLNGSAPAVPVAGASVAPQPVIPTQVAPEDHQALLDQANALISAGADPEAVRARLLEMGISVQ